MPAICMKALSSKCAGKGDESASDECLSGVTVQSKGHTPPASLNYWKSLVKYEGVGSISVFVKMMNRLIMSVS